MIKAVIFDCFGVLAEDAWLDFKHKHFKTKVESAFATQKLREHDTGLLSAQEFSLQVSQMTGVDAKELEEVISTHQSKNTKVFEYIPTLKAQGLKIGLLSNVGEDWLNHFLTPQDRALFDDILLSYKVNLTKPDPLIYQMSADRLGLLTTECLLVDDRQYCLDGAIEVNMQTVLYESFDGFKEKLEALLKQLNPQL